MTDSFLDHPIVNNRMINIEKTRDVVLRTRKGSERLPEEKNRTKACT